VLATVHEARRDIRCLILDLVFKAEG